MLRAVSLCLYPSQRVQSGSEAARLIARLVVQRGGSARTLTSGMIVHFESRPGVDEKPETPPPLRQPL